MNSSENAARGISAPAEGTGTENLDNGISDGKFKGDSPDGTSISRNVLYVTTTPSRAPFHDDFVLKTKKTARPAFPRPSPKPLRRVFRQRDWFSAVPRSARRRPSTNVRATPSDRGSSSRRAVRATSPGSSSVDARAVHRRIAPSNRVDRCFKKCEYPVYRIVYGYDGQLERFGQWRVYESVPAPAAGRVEKNRLQNASVRRRNYDFVTLRSHAVVLHFFLVPNK